MPDRRHKTSPAPDTTLNEAYILNRRTWRLLLLLCPAGGFLYAAALPPLNLSFAAFVALLPVMVYVSQEPRWYLRALAGWLWGWCWAICSYFFLREIEWFVPWLMAPVMALFPMVWAILLGTVSRSLLFPPLIEACGIVSRREYLKNGPPVWRLVVMGTAAAALYTVIECSRYRIFVWNDLAVTQYRNLALIQIAALTGSSGVGFGVALVNSAWWMLYFRRGWRATVALLALTTLFFLSGWCYTRWRPLPAPDGEWKVLAIQGDLSQRRHPKPGEAEEALRIYRELSEQGLRQHPEADIIIWPESAIPLVYGSGISLPPSAKLHALYRSVVRNLTLHNRKKLLFGALEFEEIPPKRFRNEEQIPGITNSALLVDEWGEVIARYDKYHRVPFGEYVPFRRYLPDALVKMVDMGRDLVPGKHLSHIAELKLPAKQGRGACRVRPGMVICYEGVFGYVTGEIVRNGANVLVAISNDAWYPHSSEPEQHLANATLRAVECGVPMVRVGNNSGTGIVMPDGSFDQPLEVPGPESRFEIRRGRGARLLRVPVTEFPAPTVYLRFGYFFPVGLTFFVLLIFIYTLWQQHTVMNGLDELQETLDREKSGSETRNKEEE